MEEEDDWDDAKEDAMYKESFTLQHQRIQRLLLRRPAHVDASMRTSAYLNGLGYKM
jgi:hypothetical protein